MHLNHYIFATIGSPAAECAYFGICSVELVTPQQWEQFRPVHIRHVKAILEHVDASQITIVFHRESLLGITRKKFFASGVFQVDAPLTLPDTVCTALGLCPDTRLMPGCYPIEEDADWYRIVFPIAVPVVGRLAA